jgi:hypothetical protein
MYFSNCALSLGDRNHFPFTSENVACTLVGLSFFFVRQPLVIDQVSIKKKKWCVLWLNREAGSIIYAEVMVTELQIIKFLNLSPPC